MKVMWRLSWPAIIEQILATMVSYVDTAMVGVMGAAGTAAVSVNAAPIWLSGGLLVGVGVGYSVQVSNAIGAGDDERARQIIRQGVLATLVTGFLGLLLFQALAPLIPRWLGAKPEVLPPGGLLPAVLHHGHALYRRRLHLLRHPAVYGQYKGPAVLQHGGQSHQYRAQLFPHLPHPDGRPLRGAGDPPRRGAGGRGAAIASASALAFAGGALLIAGFRQGERFRISLHDSFRPDRAIIRQAVHLGVPTAAERCTINLGQIAMTAVVASLSTVALAANHIATTAEGLCYLPAYGISFAGIALVGQAVGAGSEEDAQAYGRLAALLGFFLTLGTAVALFLLAPYLAALFNSDAEVVAQAALMLRIVSVSEPFFALSIILSGALRGAHDVRFPMVVGLLCMWGVRIVLAPILVYRAGMGLAGVWTAMAADLILRGVLCALRWRSGKWKTICGLERAGVLR